MDVMKDMMNLADVLKLQYATESVDDKTEEVVYNTVSSIIQKDQ